MTPENLSRYQSPDTGIGIREEDLPCCLESFQQVDSSTTRAAEGTGLGLTARQILD